MTGNPLAEIFGEIQAPPENSSDRPLYAVMQVPGHSSYFVGRDKESFACLLVSTRDRPGRPHPPIRLETLDVLFELRCNLKKSGQSEQEGVFTVIRCRDSDRETTQYFLSVCETILHMLGDNPSRAHIATAVNRLVAIFQRIRQSPTRPLNGLFGELYLILRSGNAVRTLAAWRTDERARFDFSDGDIRLDVKAAGCRNRIHTFSYEQCNPPSDTIAVAASLHAEQIAGGSSLRSIIDKIGARVSTHADLILKLHETVAMTLGTGLNDALSRRFDVQLAESSLRFFSLEDVPAIRGPLPAGVSDVHFRSDLSTLAPYSIEELVDKNHVFWDLLPKSRI